MLSCLTSVGHEALPLSAVQARVALVSENTSLDLYMLSYHAGVTMQVLAEMSATPLFYHRQVPFPGKQRLPDNGLFYHMQVASSHVLPRTNCLPPHLFAIGMCSLSGKRQMVYFVFWRSGVVWCLHTSDASFSVCCVICHRPDSCRHVCAIGQHHNAAALPLTSCTYLQHKQAVKKQSLRLVHLQ